MFQPGQRGGLFGTSAEVTDVKSASRRRVKLGDVNVIFVTETKIRTYGSSRDGQVVNVELRTVHPGRNAKDDGRGFMVYVKNIS